MRRTLQHLIETIAGGGDTDSVTRRIRHSLAHRRSRPATPHRGFIAELVDAVNGRNLHSTIRQLALRKHRH
ncbi:MAG TPA: hypothetical protein VM779_09595 [Thermoanaerobaculia bacterium]|nr:hypothetical protein [Thermoanaerobaculia bacterium]